MSHKIVDCSRDGYTVMDGWMGIYHYLICKARCAQYRFLIQDSTSISHKSGNFTSISSLSYRVVSIRSHLLLASGCEKRFDKRLI